MDKKTNGDRLKGGKPDRFSAPAHLPVNALEHFHALVQSSDDAIISKSLRGIVTSWNRGAQALFGYTEEEMLGQSLLKLFPPDRIDEERLILNKILAGQRVDHLDTVRVHKDGHLLDISVTISPIRDQHGRIVGASKIARDISERIRLEKAAQQFEAIVQSSDDAIIGMSLDGIITSWNPGAEAMFGYAAREMLGKSMNALIPSDMSTEEIGMLARLKSGNSVEHFETKRIRKDGRLIELSVTLSPIRNKEGKMVGASKIARDITAQKSAEQRLRLTSNVFTHTSEAIIITDSEYIIVEVNAAFSRIAGYSREDVIGKHPRMFMSGRHGPELVIAMQRSLEQSGHYQGEVWCRRKDGTPYSGLLTISRVLNRAGGVENYIALFVDMTALRVKQEQLEHLAHFDALTDLPNRILLSDRLHQAMATSRRHQQSFAVLYLDLDGFKSVNDAYGHEMGDAVLIEVSKCMTKAMRDGDTLARIGGDEYVAVLQDVKSAFDCSQLVDRILRACAEPVNIDGKVLQISASIGVTIFPHDAGDADQLLRHADRAMYEAKQGGKNRYHLFDASIEDAVRSRAQELASIRHALNAGEFVLYYQPKVNMRTGAVLAVEALIRWHHPERGVLLPAEFLPIIENHPLHEILGNWVLETAVAQMDGWRKQGLTLLLCVNIGSRQLLHAEFTSHLSELLAAFPDFNPEGIELEILETSALEDMQAVSRIMQRCRALGVRFAIDDFGTGYSSLTYLKHLPVEMIKIDQSFIQDMLNDQEDMTIVQGVIGLATAFGRQVIAEGVETVETGEKLLDLGCDLGQGFVIARPMPSDLIPHWISQWRSYATWH